MTMHESSDVQIERLSGSLKSLENTQDRIDSRLGRIQNELEGLRRGQQQNREHIATLTGRANEAQSLAREVADKLEKRHQDDEADARMRSKWVARLNYGVGIVALLVATWSGGLKSGFDYLVTFLRNTR